MILSLIILPRSTSSPPGEPGEVPRESLIKYQGNLEPQGTLRLRSGQAPGCTEEPGYLIRLSLGVPELKLSLIRYSCHDDDEECSPQNNTQAKGAVNVGFGDWTDAGASGSRNPRKK